MNTWLFSAGSVLLLLSPFGCLPRSPVEPLDDDCCSAVEPQQVDDDLGMTPADPADGGVLLDAMIHLDATHGNDSHIDTAYSDAATRLDFGAVIDAAPVDAHADLAPPMALRCEVTSPLPGARAELIPSFEDPRLDAAEIEVSGRVWADEMPERNCVGNVLLYHDASGPPVLGGVRCSERGEFSALLRAVPGPGRIEVSISNSARRSAYCEVAHFEVVAEGGD